MQTISARPGSQLGSIVGGTLLGSLLVAAGLGLAFLVIETPFVTRLMPTAHAESGQLAATMVVWVLALIAGAGFSVAGTNRLATTVARVRIRAAKQSPVARMLSNLPDDVVVATNVVPDDGRPIPELVVGPFGVAIVHEMGSPDAIRRVGSTWEMRTPMGWEPTESPLDRVNRDVVRIRHWMTNGDLDFVVHVYAGLVTDDPSIPRSSLCAVITADQIPAWFAALPRQRSLTAGRRNHLVARVRAVSPDLR